MTLDTSVFQQIVQDVPSGIIVAFKLVDARMGLGAPNYVVHPDGGYFAISKLDEAARNTLPHQQTGDTVEHLVSLGWRAYSSVWVPKGHRPYEPEAGYEQYYPINLDDLNDPHTGGILTPTPVAPTISIPVAQARALDAVESIRATLTKGNRTARHALERVDDAITKAFESV